MPKKMSRWEESKSAAWNARSVLPGLVLEYSESGKALINGRRSAKRLHKFRLRTKRLRYIMELLRPCCGRALDTRLKELRSIQQDLGEVNDCATTRRLLLGSKPARTRQLTRLSKFLENRAADKTAALIRRLPHSLKRLGKDAVDARPQDSAGGSVPAKGRSRPQFATLVDDSSKAI